MELHSLKNMWTEIDEQCVSLCEQVRGHFNVPLKACGHTHDEQL